MTGTILSLIGSCVSLETESTWQNGNLRRCPSSRLLLGEESTCVSGNGNYIFNPYPADQNGDKGARKAMKDSNYIPYEDRFTPELIQAVIRGERQNEYTYHLIESIYLYVSGKLKEFPEADIENICSELRDLVMRKEQLSEVMHKGNLDFIRYLCRTMSNFVCSEIRRLRRQQKYIAKSLDAPISSDQEDITFLDTLAAPVESGRMNPMDNDYFWATVEKAIDDLLNEDESQCFRLRFIHEWSYEEIAEAIGTSVTNIGVMVYRIKKKFQPILKKYL